MSEEWDGYTERRQSHGMETRLIRLEVTLENFSRDITRHINEHALAMRAIAEKLEALRPPLAQVLTIGLSFVGVVLLIVGMVGKVAVFDPHNGLQEQFVAFRREVLADMKAAGDQRRALEVTDTALSGRVSVLEERMSHNGLIGQTPKEMQR